MRVVARLGNVWPQQFGPAQPDADIRSPRFDGRLSGQAARDVNRKAVVVVQSVSVLCMIHHNARVEEIVGHVERGRTELDDVEPEEGQKDDCHDRSKEHSRLPLLLPDRLDPAG